MTEEEEREESRGILGSFTRERKNLIPLLQEVQEKLGYLPRHAMLEVAEFLRMPESAVYGVATFYNQFRFTPLGRHPVKVCLGTACHMKGGKLILEAWERELGIEVGETTPDREYSLDRVACVGCCALAPVSVVEGEVEGRVSPIRVKGILLSYQLKEEKQQDGSSED